MKNPMHAFINSRTTPHGWRRLRLGGLGKISTGGTPPRGNKHFFQGAVPWVKTGDLTNGPVYQTEECLSCEGVAISACNVLPANETVMVAMYGGFKQIGRTGLLKIEGATNQAISSLVCNGEAHPEFLLHWLNGYRFYWKRLAGSSRKDPNITKNDVSVFPVVLPSYSEQTKIADILSAWDKSLVTLASLIDAKELRKKGLMQRLMGGRTRLTHRKTAWPTITLGDVARNVADANKGRMGHDRLYGVTKADGVVPMRDHVKGSEFGRCKHVEPGWFAYNPMRINIGSIARWKGPETVMVSGDYVVFRCLENHLLPAFLDHFRHTARWKYFMKIAGSGSVRVRIYFRDLAELAFPCPPIEEQQAIADVLDACDAELDVLKRQRAAIDHQRRGLMQRLLTGKVRVRLSS